MQPNRAQVAVLSGAILIAALLARALAPHELMGRAFTPDEFETLVPPRFAGWTYIPAITLVSPDAAIDEPAPADAIQHVYSRQLGRGYADANGHVVMLLVAYGPRQDFQSQAHRPELCYVAAGFRVSNKTSATVPARDAGEGLHVTRFTALREGRIEPVTYWMRIGDELSHGVVDRQLIRLRYGVRGLIPDGALFRVSTIGLSPQRSFVVQDQFIRDLLAALRPEDLPFFLGTR